MQNKVSQFQTLILPRQSNVRTFVLGGACVLAVFISMYVYFVGKIVFDVVAERTADASIHSSQSQISSLEVNYYNTIKTVTIAEATDLGLSESKDTLYASRPVADAATVGMVIRN